MKRKTLLLGLFMMMLVLFSGIGYALTASYDSTDTPTDKAKVDSDNILSIRVTTDYGSDCTLTFGVDTYSMNEYTNQDLYYNLTYVPAQTYDYSVTCLNESNNSITSTTATRTVTVDKGRASGVLYALGAKGNTQQAKKNQGLILLGIIALAGIVYAKHKNYI